MEAKLREYRELRHRRWLEQTAARASGNQSSSTAASGMSNANIDEAPLINNSSSPTGNFQNGSSDGRSEISEIEFPEGENKKPESWRYFIIKWTLYSITWLTLYVVFLKLQFGAVFFAVSVLIGIYLNTRTRPKKEGELSAYSVFNENCVSIEGTLTAEQFEKEIRYGPGTV